MKIVDYVQTAQTNLLRTKARTILTVLAFVIGTFTLAMVTAFTQGLRSYLNVQLNAYGQTNEMFITVGSTAAQTSSSGVPYYQSNRQVSQGGNLGERSPVYSLNQHDLSIVSSTPGIVRAYPDYQSLKLDYIQYQNSPKYVVQVQSAFPGQITTLDTGSFPTSNQVNGIVIPFSYVEALGASSPGDLIGKTVNLRVSSTYTGQPKLYSAVITGVLPDTVHEPGAYLSNQLMQVMNSYQNGNNIIYPSIVAFTDTNTTKQDRQTIKSNLQSKGYKVQTYDDLISSFSRPLSIVTAGLTGFAAIALLAATIGIVNTLLMAVLERTQEIGLLKALGMRRRGITFIYLTEAASIGFWGGIIGVVLGFLVGLALNPILNRTLFKGIGSAHLLKYPLPIMAGIVVGAILIGLIAGTLPAIRAGKLDPIEALRRE